MQTLGREQEKEKLKAFSYYRGDYAPHWSIIDIFHDWADGKIACAPTLEKLCAIIDAHPTIKVIDTVGYWFRRVVEEEPAFEAYIEWLASNRKALVRAAAPLEMREPRSPADFTRFDNLLGDRAKEVRRSLLGAVRYGRWYSVLDRLASKIDDGDPLSDVRAFVQNGFARRDGYVHFYNGKLPGGAGSIQSAPEENCKHVPFERISTDELIYRVKHGVWPSRPENDLRLDKFARWIP